MDTATVEAPPAPASQSDNEPLKVSFKRPALYPKQEAAVYDPARYSLIEAGTKSGKTAGCIVWLTEQAFKGRKGWNYWWVAPVYAQAKIAFNRTINSLTPGTFTKNESELYIKLNLVETVMWFKGADKPDTLYGEDVVALVADEASRMKEDAWIALRSTLTATNGHARIIGNVKGKKNWFYKFARRAQSGFKDAAFHKITCWDAVEAGVLDQDEILDAKSLLPEHVFKQLYGAEAADDEGNPFGIEAIEALTRPGLSELPVACWGWDFAKSNDWTVGVGLDRNGDVAALERFQMPWGVTKERVKAKTAGRMAIGDSTGVGDAIVEDLQRMGVALEAFVFTSRSKQQIMEGLAADIQQGKGKIPEGVLAEELKSFEYTYTQAGVRYSAPEGLHDDAVCAYALARHLFRRGVGDSFVFQTTGNGGSEGDTVYRQRDFMSSGRSCGVFLE